MLHWEGTVVVVVVAALPPLTPHLTRSGSVKSDLGNEKHHFHPLGNPSSVQLEFLMTRPHTSPPALYVNAAVSRGNQRRMSEPYRRGETASAVGSWMPIRTGVLMLVLI